LLVYSRFRKWIEDGTLDNIFRVLSLEAELTELSMDVSIVKAHQHNAGAKKGGGSHNVLEGLAMELRYEQSKQFHSELSGCIFVGIPVFQNFQAAVMKLYGSILLSVNSYRLNIIFQFYHKRILGSRWGNEKFSIRMSCLSL